MINFSRRKLESAELLNSYQFANVIKCKHELGLVNVSAQPITSSVPAAALDVQAGHFCPTPCLCLGPFGFCNQERLQH